MWISHSSVTALYPDNVNSRLACGHVMPLGFAFAATVFRSKYGEANLTQEFATMDEAKAWVEVTVELRL